MFCIDTYKAHFSWSLCTSRMFGSVELALWPISQLIPALTTWWDDMKSWVHCCTSTYTSFSLMGHIAASLPSIPITAKYDPIFFNYIFSKCYMSSLCFQTWKEFNRCIKDTTITMQCWIIHQPYIFFHLLTPQPPDILCTCPQFHLCGVVLAECSLISTVISIFHSFLSAGTKGWTLRHQTGPSMTLASL